MGFGVLANSNTTDHDRTNPNLLSFSRGNSSSSDDDGWPQGNNWVDRSFGYDPNIIDFTPARKAYVSLLIALSTLVLVHSQIIHGFGRRYTNIRLQTELGAAAALLAGICQLITVTHLSPTMWAVAYELFANGLLTMVVQVADNYMFLDRLCVVRKVSGRARILYHLYIWVVLVFTWIPTNTIVPFFYDMNSDEALYIYGYTYGISNYGVVAYNAFTTFEVVRTLFALSSKMKFSSPAHGRRRSAPSQLRRPSSSSSLQQSGMALNVDTQLVVNSNNNANTSADGAAAAVDNDDDLENAAPFSAEFRTRLRFIRVTAIKSVGHCLTSTLAAMLWQELVEIADPFNMITLVLSMHFWFNMKVERYFFSMKPMTPLNEEEGGGEGDYQQQRRRQLFGWLLGRLRAVQRQVGHSSKGSGGAAAASVGRDDGDNRRSLRNNSSQLRRGVRLASGAAIRSNARREASRVSSAGPRSTRASLNMLGISFATEGSRGAARRSGAVSCSTFGDRQSGTPTARHGPLRSDTGSAKVSTTGVHRREREESLEEMKTRFTNTLMLSASSKIVPAAPVVRPARGPRVPAGGSKSSNNRIDVLHPSNPHAASVAKRSRGTGTASQGGTQMLGDKRLGNAATSTASRRRSALNFFGGQGGTPSMIAADRKVNNRSKLSLSQADADSTTLKGFELRPSSCHSSQALGCFETMLSGGGGGDKVLVDAAASKLELEREDRDGDEGVLPTPSPVATVPATLVVAANPGPRTETSLGLALSQSQMKRGEGTAVTATSKPFSVSVPSTDAKQFRSFLRSAAKDLAGTKDVASPFPEFPPSPLSSDTARVSSWRSQLDDGLVPVPVIVPDTAAATTAALARTAIPAGSIPPPKSSTWNSLSSAATTTTPSVVRLPAAAEIPRQQQQQGRRVDAAMERWRARARGLNQSSPPGGVNDASGNNSPRSNKEAEES